MARRWLVNTTTNRLAGVIDDDNATVFPSGRAVVHELVIRGSGAARNTIKAGGLWVVVNGVGIYTPPPAATASQIRARRRRVLARNIQKNWLPAASGALQESYPATMKRLRLQLDAMTRVMLVNDSVDNHYQPLLEESEVNGFDFVRYAGPAWDNPTDGYYREAGNYPQGAWTFHTIHGELAGSPTDDATGGTNHASIQRTTTQTSTFNWQRELWKLANP